MKNIVLVFAATLFLVSCNLKAEKEQQVKVNYASFGDKISDKNVISKEEMTSKFQKLNEGDTISLKFASNINEVCKKKGCWMKLDLANDKESMVRFKDYGFFVPLDADNKDVIVEGKAFVTQISVDQLRHYAKDAGKTEQEIAEITEPKTTYAFEANGVLIKE